MDSHKPAPSSLRLKPRIIIHGGAGNIVRDNFPPEKLQAFRKALLTIVRPWQHPLIIVFAMTDKCFVG